MGRDWASGLFVPVVRAIGQLGDPAFRSVVLHSVTWALACFAALYVGSLWIIHNLLQLHGLVAWAADIAGGVGAILLAFWLFLPCAAAIGTLYFDRIAGAVENRFYPWLPPPRGASVMEQTLDGATLALKVLALNVIALILTVMLPGAGFFLGWAIAAYAIGRGLFVAVAMRRMSKSAAEYLYRACRGRILVQGAMLAALAYIPMLNLLLPVIGTAAMVHAVDLVLTHRRKSASG